LQKSNVLSLEWKIEGVMDDESGESMELIEEVSLKGRSVSASLHFVMLLWFIQYRAKRLTRKNVSEIICFISTGT